MSQLVQVPYDGIKSAQLEAGWKVQVYTPDLLPEQVAALAGLSKTTGWFVLKPNSELTEADIPTQDAPVEAGEKSPSQRLYAVLYVYWQQQGAKGDFDSFRRRHMEQITNRYKEKLI